MTLAELRKKRGLTMEAVALLAGIDKGEVSRIERGRVRARPETTVRLAKALGIGAYRMAAILEASQPTDTV